MKNKNGFTIIEVSLVLAIAGLILLLAFLALPGLQRSQRDSRRKDDVIKLADSIKKYQSNQNRGALPTSQSELNSVKTSFIGGNFTDPENVDYILKYVKCDDKSEGAKCTTVSDRPTMTFVSAARCDENNEAVRTANKRKGAILYKLEVSDSWCYEL